MVSACGDLGERWSEQAVGDKADGGKQMQDHGQEVERSAIDNGRAPWTRIALTATDGVL
jgi:hypothetical protein